MFCTFKFSFEEEFSAFLVFATVWATFFQNLGDFSPNLLATLADK
jgi:hypothetical protein